MPTPGQVRATLDRYCEAASSGEVERMLDCYAEGASVVDPYPAPPQVGSDAIAAFFHQMFAAARPMAFLAERAVVAGDRVAFCFAMEAKADDGTTLSFEGIERFTIDDDGLITEQVAYWDPASIRRNPPAG